MPSRPGDGRPPAAPSDSPPAPESPPSKSACVLLHAPGSLPPPALVASLQRHGAVVQSCTDVYAMLAHACRITGATGTPRGSAVLVLVDPAGLSGVVELVHALRRYVPRCAVWYYDRHSAPPLRAVTSTEIAAWTAATEPKATSQTGRSETPAGPWTPARSVRPALRLTEPIVPLPSPISSPPRTLEGLAAENQIDHDALTNTAGNTSMGGALLTAEELAMLLGDHDQQDLAPPDEAGAGGGGGQRA